MPAPAGLTCAIAAAALQPLAAVAAGNLAADATRLEELKFDSAALSMSQNGYVIETGKYYRWRIVHDGGEEFEVVAPELFRNSWISQVVINDLEVKPMGGLWSVEFDDAGTIDIWFVPIRPGSYEFWVEGYEDRGLRGTFEVN
jgi:hypothetical protein